jgi:hypothetical protein
MTTTEILTKATELNNDIFKVNKELKRIASVKCRLKKMPGRATFEIDLANVLKEEELLKSVRDYLVGPRKNVNTLDADEIALMDYEEVCKAIRSIQSKKTHTKLAEDCLKDDKGLFIPGSGDQYKEACRIEQMLLDRRAELKPVDNVRLRKSDLQALLDSMKCATDMTAEDVIERIEAFLKGGDDDAV